MYTIPPAVALTVVLHPLLTRLDLYKICFLLCVRHETLATACLRTLMPLQIAVAYTIPWDSYLIHNAIWTYPPDAVIGPTLFRIPAEEVFFFVIQTYNTTLLYILVNKSTLFPIYLRSTPHDHWTSWRLTGQAILGGAVAAGAYLLMFGNEGVYLGLILVWAGPVLLLLWTLAYQFLLGLPLLQTVFPVALPTLYLWVIDTIALRRGTWVIEVGTKLDIHLWRGLEIE